MSDSPSSPSRSTPTLSPARLRRRRCHFLDCNFSQRMELSAGSLWDFVSKSGFVPVRYIFHASNLFWISNIPSALNHIHRWHMVCSFSGQHKKIGFPGWPEPNLDSVSGFGVSIRNKGACTSPLFHFAAGFSDPVGAGLQPGLPSVSFPVVCHWRRILARSIGLKKWAAAGGSGRSGVGMEGTVIRS